MKGLFTDIPTWLNYLTLQGRKPIIVSTLLLSNLENLVVYLRKGLSERKDADALLQSNQNSVLKKPYWQKNRVKEFIVPSLWSC